MAEFRRVADVNDIPPGKGVVLEIDGRRIAVFNVEGVFYAIDSVCTHRGGPLDEGKLRGAIVNCPWHGSQFDVMSGQAVSPPASISVARYPAKVEEDAVWVGTAFSRRGVN